MPRYAVRILPLIVLLVLAGAAAGADERVIAYRDTTQGKLSMHLFLPDRWKAADKRPVQSRQRGETAAPQA